MYLYDVDMYYEDQFALFENDTTFDPYDDDFDDDCDFDDDIEDEDDED